LINSILVALVPALVRLTSGASLADFGLSLENLKEQVTVGAGAALLMTPPVLAIQSLAVRVWHSQKHPVEQMVLDRFSPGIAILAVISTIILAPMIEELLFRGIVQRWLTRLLGHGSVSMTFDKDKQYPELMDDDLIWTSDAEATSIDEDTEIDKPNGENDQVGSATRSTLAIILTSLFFAAMHLPQWPAPIAIFLLSLALGALYQRTGSLIAVIVMHGTFNGFSTLLLLLEALSRQIQPNNSVPQPEPLLGLLSYIFTQASFAVQFISFVR
jgi:membrane protease YdiL (CAAX protease family)